MKNFNLMNLNQRSAQLRKYFLKMINLVRNLKMELMNKIITITS